MILPGGHGYPANYRTGTDLKLQENVSRWSPDGGSLPFIVVMPVLNPDSDHCCDGSAIPGEPKTGTLMTEDVPHFFRAISAPSNPVAAGRSCGRPPAGSSG
ncbi:hypothetical protein [Streptomyces sp. MUM 178J]|uniref:hypothetical protein n=1 Tax=Streptomyces sp. MUM 178J TaxID=2791991 RepID=UPI0027E24DFC|nr:hypothetical protein [Streptomyces sp. MUM 178J]WRQ82006.1 hypothetical protein I3F59_023030 [Streptomyces sp. MUM 178J]